MRDMLPKLFFVHFSDTSLVAERDGELAGFLVGFLSQSEPEKAYVHFAGVDPGERHKGLGRELYGRFFALARAAGRRHVSCVTSPTNTGSVAFHRAIGFEPGPPQADYDGPARTGSCSCGFSSALGHRNQAVIAAATMEPLRPRARSPSVSV